MDPNHSIPANGTGGEQDTKAQSTVPVDDPQASVPETTTDIGAGASTSEAPQEVPSKPQPSYEELFPSLGSAKSGAPASSAAAPKSIRTPGVRATGATEIMQVPASAALRRTLGEKNPLDDVMSRTNTNIEASTSKDGTLTLIIRGKPNDVIEAKRLLIKRLRQSVTLEMDVPKTAIPYVLGKGGKNIEKIRNETGCNINVQRNTDENVLTERFVIVGDKPSVEKARTAIQMAIDENDRKAMESVVVPRDLRSFVAGANNSNIKGIMERTNTRIAVPPPSSDDDHFRISGDKDDVAEAVNEINRLLVDKQSNTTEMTVKVKKAQHRLLRRALLNEIFSETGCVVDLPPKESEDEMVTIRGESTALPGAFNLLMAKVNSVGYEEVDAPLWMHRNIVGRKGANLTKIMEEAGEVGSLRISIRAEEEKIEIEGPKKAVEHASDALRKQVDFLTNSWKIEEISVSPALHKHLIGKGGQNIKRIKEECGVEIDFPDSDDKESSTIRIEGEKSGVAKAVDEIATQTAKLVDMVTIEVPVPLKYHGQIIGAKGARITELRNTFGDVQVNVPKPTENKDSITVKGQKADAEAVKTYILELLAEIKEQDFTLKVPIFKPYHRRIVGRKGENINRIRAETDCRIQVPDEGDPSDAIEVIGTKENAERAKQLLLELQAEIGDVVSKVITLSGSVKAPSGSDALTVAQAIGNSGTVRAAASGMTVVVEPKEKDGSKLALKGPDAAVKKCEKEIEEVMEAMGTGKPVTLDIKGSSAKILVAKRTDVQKKHNVKLVLPDEYTPATQTATVYIVGSGDLEGAKAAVTELAETFSKAKTFQLNFDRVELRTLSKSKKIVQDIEKQHGAMIDVGNNWVSVTCAEDNVPAVKEALEAIRPTVLTMNIPLEYHRHLIGSGGKGIKDLQDNFQAFLDFPSIKEKSERVVIAGTPENAMKLMQHLQQTVDQMKKEGTQAVLGKQSGETYEYKMTLEVDPKLFPSIIGAKGKTINQIRTSTKCRIQLPQKGSSNRSITIEGTEENCREAKARIMEIIEEKRGNETTIDIDPRVHGKIIGARGEQINGIRAEYGVQVQFPKDKNDPTITLAGDPKAVEECAAHLKELAEGYLSELATRSDNRNRRNKNDADDDGQQERQQREKKQPQQQRQQPPPQQPPPSAAFPTMTSSSPSTTSTPSWGPHLNRQ
eukprot:Clim_evm4s223 gene=Clim_evmTU4s223